MPIWAVLSTFAFSYKWMSIIAPKTIFFFNLSFSLLNQTQDAYKIIFLSITIHFALYMLGNIWARKPGVLSDLKWDKIDRDWEEKKKKLHFNGAGHKQTKSNTTPNPPPLPTLVIFKSIETFVCVIIATFYNDISTTEAWSVQSSLCSNIVSCACNEHRK